MCRTRHFVPLSKTGESRNVREDHPPPGKTGESKFAIRIGDERLPVEEAPGRITLPSLAWFLLQQGNYRARNRENSGPNSSIRS